MWAILAAVLLVNNAAGSVLPETRSSIIGGADAPVGRWPWMVNLWITNGIDTWKCGGSLLTDEWVMTAAHCVRTELMPPLPKFSFARLGTSDLKETSEFYRGLSEFVVHPQYETIHHDIALVRLDERVTFSRLVSPVRLPAKGEVFWPKAECLVTGWGDAWGQVKTLQQLNVAIIKQSACGELVHNLTSSMICAGSPNDYDDACEGDVGGPLVCRSTCGFVQVGIASGQFAVDCAEGSPGLYTRVSNYMDFINDITQCNLEASSEI